MKKRNYLKKLIIQNRLFLIMLSIMMIIIVGAFLKPDEFKMMSNFLFSLITEKFGWLYLLGMFLFVIFIIWIGISKYGDIVLGDENTKPEHSTFSWLAMLFCAGMGVGLVFW